MSNEAAQPQRSEPEFIDEIDERRSEMQAGKRILESASRDSCTCDNASGLHWGTCPLNMKVAPETCANPDCLCVAASSEPLSPDERESINKFYMSHFSESSEPPQEWIEGDDGWIIAGNKAWQTVNVEDAQEAIDAHNSALAAEREKRERRTLKPLVAALEWLLVNTRDNARAQNKIATALTQVKEKK